MAIEPTGDRFWFGANWRDFAGHALDADAWQAARDHLASLMPFAGSRPELRAFVEARGIELLEVRPGPTPIACNELVFRRR